MRRKLIFVFISLLAIVFFYTNNISNQILSNNLVYYYIENFYKDTGARNAVAAIYLNYRVYDTIFEALMLLVCVLSVIHFSKSRG